MYGKRRRRTEGEKSLVRDFFSKRETPWKKKKKSSLRQHDFSFPTFSRSTGDAEGSRKCTAKYGRRKCYSCAISKQIFYPFLVIQNHYKCGAWTIIKHFCFIRGRTEEGAPRFERGVAKAQINDSPRPDIFMLTSRACLGEKARRARLLTNCCLSDTESDKRQSSPLRRLSFWVAEILTLGGEGERRLEERRQKLSSPLVPRRRGSRRETRHLCADHPASERPVAGRKKKTQFLPCSSPQTAHHLKKRRKEEEERGKTPTIQKIS